MGRISALTELTSLANDDYLLVLDSSANIGKKISVANAFGIPDFGFTATGETWTYSSWTSGTRIGEITVPTDATTKYTAGMRIRISQSTGGTKYGIIVKVAATTLTVFFPSGTTLNNEAISTPFYATTKIPYGFPVDKASWTLELEDTGSRLQASPSSGTWYNTGSLSLAVGIGAWRIGFKATLASKDTAGNLRGAIALSNANNTANDADLVHSSYVSFSSSAAVEYLFPTFASKEVVITSPTTYYLNTQGANGLDSIGVRGDFLNGNTRIFAECSYL